MASMTDGFLSLLQLGGGGRINSSAQVDTQLQGALPTGLANVRAGEQVAVKVAQILPQGRVLVNVSASTNPALSSGQLLLDGARGIRLGQGLTLEMTTNQLGNYLTAKAALDSGLPQGASPTSTTQAATTTTPNQTAASPATTQPSNVQTAPPDTAAPSQTAPQSPPASSTPTNAIASNQLVAVANARVLTIDGAPPVQQHPQSAAVNVQLSADAAKASGQPLSGAGASSTTVSQPTTVQIVLPQIPNFTALPPVASGDVADSSSIRLQSGTTLNTTVLQPQTTLANNTPLPAPLNGQPPQAGAQLTVQLQQVVLPGQSPAIQGQAPSLTTPATPQAGAPTSTIAPVPLQAIVLDVAQNGEATLRTELGTLRTSLPDNIPRGTVLEVVVTNYKPATTPSTIPVGQTPLPQVSSQPVQTNVPALQQSGVAQFPLELQGLAQKTEQLLAQLTTLTQPTISGEAPLANQLLPQLVTKQAAAKLLWFIGSLSSGDINRVVPASIRPILSQAGGEEWLQQTSELLNNWKNVQQHSTNQAWRLFPIPLYDGQTMQLAPLYVKRDKPERQNHKDDAEAPTRFVIEVALDTIGAVQLDGLVTMRGSAELNMIVRHTRTLDADVRLGVLNVFSDVQASTGFQGQLFFHHGGFVAEHKEQAWHAVTGNTGRFDVEA